jgi:hypothetical protein
VLDVGTTVWSCTEDACDDPVCTPGEVRPAEDGCNTCECLMVLDWGPAWSCSEDSCGEETCEALTGELVTPDGLLEDGETAGIQGSIYAFGDGVACTPPEGNPCSEAGCSVTGETIIDPTYAAWGCGVGVSLNASEDPEVRKPYTGPANCFEIALEGHTGSNSVRLGLASEDAAVTSGRIPPFVDIGPLDGLWEGRVCGDDVSCPDWAVAADLCDETPGGVEHPYHLHIHVPGGSSAESVSLSLLHLRALQCQAGTLPEQ